MVKPTRAVGTVDHVWLSSWEQSPKTTTKSRKGDDQNGKKGDDQNKKGDDQTKGEGFWTPDVRFVRDIRTPKKSEDQHVQVTMEKRENCDDHNGNKHDD